LSQTFTIYRSSAGSGKTRTLAKEYLKLALRYRADYFKHILAVTFTNKATQEMKDRILAYLDDFANGRPGELAQELRTELKLDELTFRQYAQEARAEILHHYSQFSISTIDAFFQKVIRSFTREAGLVGDYRLEVDQDPVLEEVIDNLIDELGNNRELTEWVVEFAKENLENERAWDVRYSLIEFAKEIFREEFKSIEDDVLSRTRTPGFFKDLLQQLRERKFTFVSFVRSRCSEALKIFQSHGLHESDFKYGGGIYNFFQKFAAITRVKDFDDERKGKRVDKEFQESKHWPDKSTAHHALIVKLAEDRLIPLLNEVLDYRSKHYALALSAEVALNNFYAFGLIADISRKLKEYKEENNLMLLADAPKFLNGVIQDSDTPFIYEKVGSFYRNYLIDEFQDTSGLQWRNFLPLLVNGLDQGYPSLIVGDVKQAIYRWRGGDLKLLQQEIEHTIGRDRVEVNELNSNFRSASAIVDFNNSLFRSSAAIVTEQTGHVISSEAYKDVAQKVSKAEEGFVQVRFFQEEKEGPKWKEQVMDEIPRYLEQWQALGIPLKDIAILVRKNDEGQQIVSHLLQYRNSEQAKPGFKYDVVSNESLRLDGAASVNLLLGAMKYLLNPDDDIARAQLAFEFARLRDPGRSFTEVFAVTNQAVFESYLPVTFTKEKASLKKLPLFELTETLIEIFALGDQQGELAYLQAFQDLVLEFFSRERNDLGAFLEWWEDNKMKKSIQVSGEVDAVQILTIHKSKGLQFKYVMIPFCSWNLDHDMMRAPNLWVNGEAAPFDKAGFLPVRYSGTLEQTLFRPFYMEEHTRSYLDNLNLLYVAFTRAEAGLLVMAPHPENRAAKKTVAQLLYLGIQQAELLQKNWDESKQELNSGTPVAMPASRAKASNALSLSVYPSSSWREKLVIRQSAGEYFRQETEKREKINYGIHMHTVLSRITYAEEIGGTLNSLVREGLITDEERQPLREQLDALLANRQIGSWFAPGWDVRTEVPILLPGGEENRVDRLMIKDRKAVIVDFKTGEHAKADQRQVLDYIETLRKMNFIDVEGYLLYIRTGEVISVTPARSKVVKKKSDSQLDLGLGL
jgi:ATP-dependent exoDNAse (exonuclease V) beta subunit